MHKRHLTLIGLCLYTAWATAQNSPVGIVSRQDTIHTAQVGLLGTVAEGEAHGAQLSLITNMSTAPLRGLQLAGITNLATGVERGLQLSSLVNVSEGFMRGAQLGGYNYADSLNGFQLGLINIARHHPRGWQVGLVNITRDTIAHKIGLVNVNPNTDIDFMLSGGSSTKLNGAVRFRNRSTYNIIGIGTHYMGLDDKFSGALFYRLGQYVHLSPRWSLSGDIGFYHIETFEHDVAGKPERLFSIQARINADYQVNDRLGLFASVGYGDTRYYHHAKSYRSRPLVEAGITLQYRRGGRAVSPAGNRHTPAGHRLLSATDSLLALPLAKRPWLGVAEVIGINAGVHLFDRFALNEDFAQTTMHSIGDNFSRGFVWDNDFFITNMFAHPYHGNLYFNSARSNGMSFWQSVPYALGGSLMWEFFGETEPPAINDVFATTMGGMAIGEVTHRMSDVILNDHDRGFSRFLRELAAAIINPVKGFNRLIHGDSWRVRSDHYLYHDHSELPIDLSLGLGLRYLADNGGLFRGEYSPVITLSLTYGDPLNEGEHNRPYDFFELETTFGLSKIQPMINHLNLLGRLWSTPMWEGRRIKAELGIYQHFNYYDSKPVKGGTGLTPYRISEAASVGPGMVFSFPEVGVLQRLEQRILLSGILLGGTKSDYYSFLDRDYNMGSGFSIKSKTHLEVRHFGRFILKANYFQIFTWKGYEDRDLSELDPHLINSQGDKGNARLVVVNPLFEFDLRRGYRITLSGAFYARRTHYAHYPDVHARTFEFKTGLSYHF